MATLISVYSNGKCIGRCDERCYNAEHDHCECICGGKNHGVGYKKAVGNTREQIAEWEQNWKEQKTHSSDKIRVSKEVKQLSLL